MNKKEGVKLECYWCYEEHDKDSMLSVDSAEFREPSHPICKECNDKYELV